MKTILTSIIALFIILCVSSANAGPQGYEVKWTFYEFVDYHYSEYSTNLDIPIAATLPVGTVKLGWACVREPVMPTVSAANGRGEMGAWTCTNGKETHYAVAVCSAEKIGTGYAQLTMTWPDVQEAVVLTASCTALGRWL